MVEAESVVPGPVPPAAVPVPALVLVLVLGPDVVVEVVELVVEDSAEEVDSPPASSDPQARQVSAANVSAAKRAPELLAEMKRDKQDSMIQSISKRLLKVRQLRGSESGRWAVGKIFVC